MAAQVMITLTAIADEVVDVRPLIVELLEVNVEISPIALIICPR
jgi:hypothetical protein